MIKRVADYDLIEEIGQGGYGKVYLATKNKKKYAVKIVKIQSKLEYEKNSKEIEILSRVLKPKTQIYPFYILCRFSSNFLFEI